ncbi:MAG TPA: hypothetical protein DIC52_25550 [Candidatus Latescibacteria bacterium]|nr:hypothetical protein [Candidatus Latescibacterota bacterium]
MSHSLTSFELTPECTRHGTAVAYALGECHTAQWEIVMSRVSNFIESEITFGAVMVVLWIGAMLFTMSAQLAVYNID